MRCPRFLFPFLEYIVSPFLGPNPNVCPKILAECGLAVKMQVVTNLANCHLCIGKQILCVK